jgi:virulence factor Mce-like protein
MITRTKVSLIGMIVIAIASFLYMDRLGLHTGVGDEVRTAQLVITDTNGLVVGSRVLLRGIAIGYVTELTPSAERVDVTWEYDRSYSIPSDSSFRVDNLSALGEPYVAVLPTSTSGPYLEDNATISPDQVVVPTTFKELSERLTRLLEQVEPDQVQNIFATIDTGLPEDVDVPGNLSRAGELLASTFTQQSDNFTTLLSTLQPLLMSSETIPGGLRGVTPHLAPFGAGFSGVLDGIRFAVQKGPLRDGIEYGVSPFLVELQKFLDQSATDLNTIGVDLLPGVTAGATSMRTVNVGNLLDVLLESTTTEGAVTVHVPTPGR